jgi:bacillithiol system protein YtxJ
MDNWKQITQESDVQNIIEKSVVKPQIIFKHSITCGISAHAEHRLINGSHLLTDKADFNYLDLLRFRSISNLIAQELNVTHQSPQVIVIKDKKVIKTTSHHAIEPAAIARYL